MNEIQARLMRAIGKEVSAFRSELQSAAAIEKAEYTRMVLNYVAADLDVLPAIAAEEMTHFRSAIETALSLLEANGAADAAACRQSYAEILPQTGTGAEFELYGLRAIAARLARALADLAAEPRAGQDTAAVQRACLALGTQDYRWLRLFDAARTKRAQAAAASAGESVSGTPPAVTPETVTAFFRRRFPQEAGLSVSKVTVIPGGRSKRTILIGLEGTTSLPSELIVRQDIAAKHIGTLVQDEYGPLIALSALGLPIPKPVHLEPEDSELGPPFLLVERIRGSAPGSYFGLITPCPEAFADLARALGKLHSASAADVGLTGAQAEATGDRLLQQIEEYEAKWRQYSLTPSPFIDYAYSWARTECRETTGTIVPVHGDCGPYNLLVENGRLEGLLDWEFLHMGDPAEDLGIARVYSDTIMPWYEFSAAYIGAGGKEFSERRVKLSMLLQYLKGTVLVARSGRNVAEGATDDFMKAANSYAGLRQIEMKIADFFDGKLKL